MPSIIISSISASKGKTALASAIISRLRYANVSVSSNVNTGSLFADDAGVVSALVDDIEPNASSVSVIEGSTGDPESDVQLAEKLDASVILMAAFDEDVPGAADAYADRLDGVVFNKVPRYREFHADRAVAAIEDAGIRCFGWIPENRSLAGNTVDDLMRHIDGRLQFDVNTTSELIDNVLIGGLVLDWGPFYFESQSNSCVVVRGGRPDVQISALQSETTRAVVLTGGVKPIDYVFYEARTKRIPLIVVDSDTQETMDSLDVMEPTGFTHPDKLQLFIQILAQRAMLEPLLELVAQPSTR